MNAFELEKRMKEIEDLQLDFDNLYLRKNWLGKLLNFRKAKMLLDFTEKKIAELFSLSPIDN